MVVRPMREQDVTQVAAIECAATEFPWPQSQFASSLSGTHHCMVLEVDGVAVGFSVFSSVLDESELLNIAVAPEQQGCGYGRQLLLCGLKQLVADDIKRCFLEVRVSNTSAQALYQSLGFKVAGKRKQYYPARNGREDALVMSREFVT